MSRQFAHSAMGVILGEVRGVRVPPLFGVGGTVPPLFKSCHKKNCLCTEKKQMLIVGKSLKLLSPEPFFLVLICTKSLIGWSFAPDPTGGSYSAPPDRLAGFKGAYF